MFLGLQHDRSMLAFRKKVACQVADSWVNTGAEIRAGGIRQRIDSGSSPESSTSGKYERQVEYRVV